MELDDGSLLAYLRTGGTGGCIWQSTSRDGGERCTRCATTDLPNPNAGIDMIRLQDGRLMLAYNPQRDGRYRMALGLSADAGQSWQSVLLDDEPKCEFSYPVLMQARDGLCHLLYTYRRQTFKHLILDPTQPLIGPPVQ